MPRRSCAGPRRSRVRHHDLDRGLGVRRQPCSWRCCSSGITIFGLERGVRGGVAAVGLRVSLASAGAAGRARRRPRLVRVLGAPAPGAAGHCAPSTLAPASLGSRRPRARRGGGGRPADARGRRVRAQASSSRARARAGLGRVDLGARRPGSSAPGEAPHRVRAALGRRRRSSLGRLGSLARRRARRRGRDRLAAGAVRRLGLGLVVFRLRAPARPRRPRRRRRVGSSSAPARAADASFGRRNAGRRRPTWRSPGVLRRVPGPHGSPSFTTASFASATSAGAPPRPRPAGRAPAVRRSRSRARGRGRAAVLRRCRSADRSASWTRARRRPRRGLLAGGRPDRGRRGNRGRGRFVLWPLGGAGQPPPKRLHGSERAGRSAATPKGALILRAGGPRSLWPYRSLLREGPCSEFEESRSSTTIA